ncbi:MAG: hemerythrin domain-containing protein [Armatimonadetes bacterium]|nr:hemerythrin domain-containing protein [Armatimonadota bacterium]MDW8153662.1 hemerythrin domain-containing protein [Armatimonadota bacterium]
MRSTEELIREHEVILGALEGLERHLRQAQGGGALQPGYVRDLVAFCQGFVDRCHHGKEEHCLFPCLERRGIPREGGPIGVMLMEHEMGRQLVRRIAEAVERYEGGQSTVEAVVELGWQYLELLRAHIAKENEILFPMGEAVLQVEDDGQVGRCYDGVEHVQGEGEHQRLTQLAERLRGG